MGHVLAIVPHQCCELTSDERELAEQTAARLLREKPELRIDPLFKDLVPEIIQDSPSLHVDDLTEIQNISEQKHAFYQERARLRARAGDMLATALPQVEGYEQYCEHQLGLGTVHWIVPQCQSNPLRLAEACWEDRQTRRDIVHQIRNCDLRYVHPHMGSQAPWQLALLLSQASHRKVEVIAPPPGVTRFANDKGEFTKLVEQLFGGKATPATSVVWNTATAAKEFRQIASSSAEMIAMKLPSSAGAEGNLLISLSDVRDRRLHEIEAMLDSRLQEIHYESGDELLVTQWVENVVAAPSAQLWIPPQRTGTPTVEGLFMQVFEGSLGHFDGLRPADFPSRLRQQMTRQSLLIAHLFQLLGYVGRCSFDMLLVGSEIETATMEFLECNGRWGGTSLPMTLMNRMFGDWTHQPFSTRSLAVPRDGDACITFADIANSLGKDLYDRETGTGRFVIYNPQRIAAQDQVSILALQQSWDPSDRLFDTCADRLRATQAKH